MSASQPVARDVVVVGAGIVGLSTALALAQSRPDLSLCVVEKEAGIAQHQTGHNSGVLHSGVYYRPGSQKATMALEGRRRMAEFCDEHHVPARQTGKLIVAVDEDEFSALRRLHERALAHGLGAELLGPSGIRDHEPYASGLAAVYVPETGVCDFVALCHKIASLLALQDVELSLGERVLGIDDSADGVIATTTKRSLQAAALVNCGGLFSDRLAALQLSTLPARIVPFRGEYYSLRGDSADQVRHLIYPVPDPKLPFLGVHITRGIDGACHVGPNAVLALAREGYQWSTVSPHDIAEIASGKDFWRLAAHNWRTAAAEIARSSSRRLYSRSAQRLMPTIRAADLQRSRAGVRAQAIGRDGRLVDDFLIAGQGRCVHVLNAPSPAATAAFPIGKAIAGRVSALLPLRHTPR
jgi:L-2-hydroxyglutarate oxidase